MILITNAYARACVASVVERPWTPPVEPRRLDPAPCFRLPTQRVVILLYILIAMNVLTQFGCEQVQLSQIFEWYSADFAPDGKATEEKTLRYAAQLRAKVVVVMVMPRCVVSVRSD